MKYVVLILYMSVSDDVACVASISNIYSVAVLYSCELVVFPWWSSTARNFVATRSRAVRGSKK
jgi:hypothetical protein